MHNVFSEYQEEGSYRKDPGHSRNDHTNSHVNITYSHALTLQIDQFH